MEAPGILLLASASLLILAMGLALVLHATAGCRAPELAPLLIRWQRSPRTLRLPPGVHACEVRVKLWVCGVCVEIPALVVDAPALHGRILALSTVKTADLDHDGAAEVLLLPHVDVDEGRPTTYVYVIAPHLGSSRTRTIQFWVGGGEIRLQDMHLGALHGLRKVVVVIEEVDVRGR